MQTVLSASLASSTEKFAIHPSTSAETIFLSGTELAKFLHSLGKEITEVDFESMKVDAPAAAAKPAVKKE